MRPPPRLHASPHTFSGRAAQPKKSKNSKSRKKSVYLKAGLGKQMENWLCNDFFSFWNYSRIGVGGPPSLKASPKHIFKTHSQARKGKNSKRSRKSVYLKKSLGLFENWNGRPSQAEHLSKTHFFSARPSQKDASIPRATGSLCT